MGDVKEARLCLSELREAPKSDAKDLRLMVDAGMAELFDAQVCCVVYFLGLVRLVPVFMTNKWGVCGGGGTTEAVGRAWQSRSAYMWVASILRVCGPFGGFCGVEFCLS